MKFKKIIYTLLILFLVPIVVTACASNQDPNISHYTCPMHPQVKMDNPGQCPICNMDLVPVKKESPSTSDHSSHKKNRGGDVQQIKIDPRYVQNIGVVTENVEVRDLTQTIQTYGKVAHDHRLWIAQNEYIEALKLKDKELIKATERKLLFLGLSDKWIETIKKTKSTDITLHLRTDKVKPKYIEAYVYQEDVGRLSEGLKVEITDQKGRFLENGKVKAIGTLVDLDSRSIRVLVESEKPLSLKLNTFVQVTIKAPLGKSLSVNTQAILFNGDHNMVYISKGHGIFEPKMIQLGHEAGLYHEVIGGLSEGDVIVTNGHFLIDSESQIKLGGSNKGHNH